MTERGDSARKSFERSVSDLSNQTSSFMQSITTGDAFTSGRGVNTSSEERNAVTESVAVLDRFAETHGVSRQTAMEVGLHASVGTPWKILSGSAKASLLRRGVNEEIYNEMTEASRTSGLDSAVSNLTRAHQDFGASQSASSSITGDNGTRLSIDELDRQANSAETYRRAAQSYATAADQAQSQFVDNRVDLSAPFADWMLDQKGMSAEQVASILNGRGTAEQNARLRAEFSEQFVNDLVAPQMAEVLNSAVPAPSNPGAAAPVPTVLNNMDPRIRPYVEQRIETEGAINSQTSGMATVQSGADSVTGRTSAAADRNADARSNSLVGFVAPKRSWLIRMMAALRGGSCYVSREPTVHRGALSKGRKIVRPKV